MIKQTSQGHYRLLGMRGGGRILHLDGQGYHWNYARGIGEILTFCKHPHKEQYVLSQGGYKIYAVQNEPHLVDLQHLELSLGNGRWQGYLLLTDLPTRRKIRSRIVPTSEVISNHGLPVLQAIPKEHHPATPSLHSNHSPTSRHIVA